MFSVGTDILEIKRIEKLMKKSSFLPRFFGSAELEELGKRGFPVQSVAAAFAAKEAFSKAVGTGISGFELKDVQILHNEKGKPYFLFTGSAEKLTKDKQFDVSMSHSDDYAVATVIAFERIQP